MSEPAPAVHPLRVLIVDDDANIRLTLSMCLESDGHQVVSCGTIAEALDEASKRVFDLVFLDIRLGMQNGLDFIPQLLAQSPWAKVVVITAFASIDTAVRAMKEGAADYLPKPFSPVQVQTVTQRVAERRLLEWKIESLQAALGSDPEADFPTANATMQQAIALARQVADSNANVLIEGEAGTGKGRLARAIHEWSGRRSGPFSIVTCESTNAETLEAELFGVGGRALAAASASETPGKVSFCEGGTLVLDEIGRTPQGLQGKLLSLVRDKEYERQNDFRLRRADVRIVATSRTALSQLVARQELRPDLLLAMDVVKVELPPLRSRREDIPLLARRYLAYFGRENHRPIAGFSHDAIHALKEHAWPGNARELRNVVERAVLTCAENEIGLKHLPPNLLSSERGCTIGDLVPLETIESMHIRGVLAAAGSIRGAAGILGVHENTLARWIRRNAAARPGHADVQPAAVGVPCSTGAADDQPAS